MLKLCYSEYWKWLQACEEEGLAQWKEVLEPHLDQMQEDWEKAKQEYETRQKEEGQAGDEPGEKPAKNELKKMPYFAQDQDIKDIFRQLVENTQEMVEINKKMEWVCSSETLADGREWGQPIQGQSSELNMRKLLYNKVGSSDCHELTADHQDVPGRLYDVAASLAAVYQLQAVGAGCGRSRRGAQGRGAGGVGCTRSRQGWR